MQEGLLALMQLPRVIAAVRKFDRAGDERKALFRMLVADLMRHERLKTTEAKAKEIRPLAEKMIRALSRKREWVLSTCSV